MKRQWPLIVSLLAAGLFVYEHFFVRKEQERRIAELEAKLAGAEGGRHPAPGSPGGKVSAAGDRDVTAAPGEPATASTPAGGKAEPEESDALDILMGAGAKEVALRTEARLKLLRDRLKLRPDQEGDLMKIAAVYNDRVLAAFERIRKGGATPGDMGVMMDWNLGGTPLDIASLLDPDQAQLYAEFSNGEREGRVEGTVNMELLELQSQASLHLTPEQKDQVFAALTEIVAGEDAIGAAYYADDGGFMTRIDASLQRRREALQGVLDESQMQNYNRMLDEDRALIRKMFPDGR